MSQNHTPRPEKRRQAEGGLGLSQRLVLSLLADGTAKDVRGLQADGLSKGIAYASLSRLKRRGLLKIVAGERRAQRKYALSQSGRSALESLNAESTRPEEER